MTNEATRDKLISDVKSLISDADDTFRAMASATGERETIEPRA